MTHNMVKVGQGERAWFRCSQESCWWVWLGTYARPKRRREQAAAQWEKDHAATVVEQARRAAEVVR